VTVASLFLAFTVLAAVKPCGRLKTEIESKLKEKGVEGYTLDIAPADQVKEETVVGSREGRSKKITYSRGGGMKTMESKE